MNWQKKNFFCCPQKSFLHSVWYMDIGLVRLASSATECISRNYHSLSSVQILIKMAILSLTCTGMQFLQQSKSTMHRPIATNIKISDFWGKTASRWWCKFPGSSTNKSVLKSYTIWLLYDELYETTPPTSRRPKLVKTSKVGRFWFVPCIFVCLSTCLSDESMTSYPPTKWRDEASI